MANRVGPTVHVKVEYRCNGCEYHQIDEDSGTNLKYHSCHHPVVVKEYTCPQWMGQGYEKLTLHNIAPTPQHICPYLANQEK